MENVHQRKNNLTVHPANRPPHRESPIGQAAGRTQQLTGLQQTIGNRAVMRMLEIGADSAQSAPVAIQRMFDPTKDFAKDMTGIKLWNKYTPDKDKGATFLNFLAASCGTPNQIDTGVLAGLGKGHQLIAGFLNGVFNNFAANSFIASSIIHSNLEERYTVDDTHPNRYAEMGITGVGQTRVVLDRHAPQTMYLSTHYEAPKVLLINGQAPAAAIAHVELQASYAD